MSNKKNIPLFKVFMSPNVDNPLLDVIHSGWIGEGPKVKEFEEKLRAFFGNPYLTTLNNGTAGLHLSYHLAQNQDEYKSYFNNNKNEIITTPITCTATNTPIISTGAKIVWADVDPITGNIDPKDIENKITKNTKAIVMVHWGGNPCEIDKINEIAKKYNIKTVEDGAHSMGMEYKGKKIGNNSDYTVLSLQAIKHITSVDGGILMTKSEKDYERVKLLRWYGIDRTIREGIDLRCELDVAEAGYKFHMNDVCAIIGIKNFEHIDEILSKHRANALFYNEAFKAKSGITISPQNPDAKSSYWLYTLHLNNRDEVMKKLGEDGIMSSKVHARNDIHSMFKDFKADLPNAQKFNDTHLCIPVGWWVSRDDREFIAEKVIKYAK
ncbi:MAG: DegT/DnrJ/EryC1/StrS family aminotransferase [Elusimicrobiota bacterium]|jgi:dTDP-4-amino-4,6-dideoxygalactose transaminase|nr:DegT/DnrJ/EryC1/StrS family aminotransferase [Elusimicrobiota bacterium]